MNFYESPTNTAARASSGGERSRWRDDNVDPELVMNPFDTLQAVLAAKAAQEAEARQAAAQRPLSAQVAAYAMSQVATIEYAPPVLAVVEEK